MAKSTKYPRADFNYALEFVEKLDSSFSANTVSYEEVEKLLGVKTNATAKFSRSVSTAEQFGLIETPNKNVKITELAGKILHPISDDENEIKKLKISAFMNSKLYSSLVERFSDDGLPTEGVLANILLNDYGILKTVKNTAAKNFLTSLNQLGLSNDGMLLTSEVSSDDTKSLGSANEIENLETQESKTQNIKYAQISLPTQYGSATIDLPTDLLEKKDSLELFKKLIDVNLDVYINRLNDEDSID